MNIKDKLDNLGLKPDNSVIIGSGVLNALGLRSSNDIDVIVSDSEYQRLVASKQFTKTTTHGREILVDEIFEIGTNWGVLDKDWFFDELKEQSVVIDGVCYITLEFLLAVKKSWLKDEDVRQKDIDDVELIQKYLEKQA